ncbi:PREDICTED: WEB family protein At5g55860-like isoform X2 [Tarenaya hassleriana]|nr:PREDICTED: WEB family protein At5g55860-like isoform X2 [Tarenaya hassleriana]
MAANAKGEIDTSAPFPSVKDAVMLFGSGRTSSPAVERPKPGSKERVLTKERKLHLAQKELNKLKEKIKNVETTKAEALLELEKARIAVDDLSDKLKVGGNLGKQKKRADSARKQDPELASEDQTTIFSKFDQKEQELGKICQNMRNEEGLDLDSVRAVTSNLDVAKESLQKVAEEDRGLCKTLETLELELKIVQDVHAQLIEKERETEAIARDLQAQLQKTKTVLEMCLVEGFKASDALGEAEAEEELRKEAEDIKIELRGLEEELETTLFVAGAARAAEERALEHVNRFALSERADVEETSFSAPVARITMSREKFESLCQKAEEFNNLAEIKVGAALAQAAASTVCRDEALETLEMSQREIKDLQAARMEALKKAVTAEGAKRAVEAELKRCMEIEQKKAIEVATLILAENEFPVKSSPRGHVSEVLKRNSEEKPKKSKTQVSKKIRLPRVGGIFHRRKNQGEARFASCLPS